MHYKNGLFVSAIALALLSIFCIRQAVLFCMDEDSALERFQSRYVSKKFDMQLFKIWRVRKACKWILLSVLSVAATAWLMSL